MGDVFSLTWRSQLKDRLRVSRMKTNPVQTTNHFFMEEDNETYIKRPLRS
jgi:hypothetical protein